MIKKIKFLSNEFLTGTFDVGLTSSLSFLIFFFIRYKLNLSFTGAFGLIISISGILETLQNGLYQKPALLNFRTGFNGKNLNIGSLFLLIIFPMYIINKTIDSNILLIGFLYCFSYLIVQNIKSYDYYYENIIHSSKRSLNIFIFTLIYFLILEISEFNSDFNLILFGPVVIRTIYIIKEKKKIFALTKLNKEKKETILFTVSSFLSFVRTRLPIWLLVPFGINFVGLYEIFRNLLEIYIFISKSTLLIFTKNLNKIGNYKTIKQSILLSVFTLTLILFTFQNFTKIQLFDFKEIRSSESFIAILIIAFSVFIIETGGLILQNNNYFKIDILRKLLSITLFVCIFIYTHRDISFEQFLLISSIGFVFELAFIFFTRKYLKLYD